LNCRSQWKILNRALVYHAFTDLPTPYAHFL